MTEGTEGPAVAETAPPAAPRNGTALAVRSEAHTLPAKIQYARELASSGLLPKAFRGNPPNVLFAIEYGDMLGLPPMAAITGIHVIEGKPSASAGLISALVRRAGHKLRVTGDARSATCQIIRCDDPDYTFAVTWTLRKNDDGNPSAEEAKLLKKDVWQNYPASMLKSRAITQCARDACEEALYGLHYTPEELGEEVDEDGHVYGGTLVGDAPATGQPAEDPWYVRPQATAWVEEAMARAKAGDLDVDKFRALWTETSEKHKAGEIADEDSKRIKDTLSARADELQAQATPAAGPANPEVVEAEIVETPTIYGLDPEDDWAAKVISVSNQEDADAAIADVDTAVGNDHMTAEHGAAVCTAIGLRLEELAGKAAA